MDSLNRDFCSAAGLEARDRGMLEYAAKLTREPWKMSPGDVDRLRDLGFSDRAILEINLVTGYIAFVNRLAEGLGVRLEAASLREFTR